LTGLDSQRNIKIKTCHLLLWQISLLRRAANGAIPAHVAALVSAKKWMPDRDLSVANIWLSDFTYFVDAKRRDFGNKYDSLIAPLCK